jgi:hypothetical protein
MKDRLEKARKAQRESKSLDFKRELNLQVLGQTCEFIKDLVAFANSGGGVIIIGCENDGNPSGFNATELLNFDQAKIVDQINKYTSCNFSDFRIDPIERDGKTMAAIQIEASEKLLLFTRAGNYVDDKGKEKAAFRNGTLYFRHGAKSEPCDYDDLDHYFDRVFERKRKQILDGVAKVVASPADSTIQVLPSGFASLSEQGVPVKLSEDPKAVLVKGLDTNIVFPYRRKEAVIAINKAISSIGVSISTTDFQCLRYYLNLDEDTTVYKPKYSSPQYSEKMVDLIARSILKDPGTIAEARKSYWA